MAGSAWPCLVWRAWAGMRRRIEVTLLWMETGRDLRWWREWFSLGCCRQLASPDGPLEPCSRQWSLVPETGRGPKYWVHTAHETRLLVSWRRARGTESCHQRAREHVLDRHPGPVPRSVTLVAAPVPRRGEHTRHDHQLAQRPGTHRRCRWSRGCQSKALVRSTPETAWRRRLKLCPWCQAQDATACVAAELGLVGAGRLISRTVKSRQCLRG